MTTFQSMGLPEALTHTLTHMNFTTPTPIQAQAIPMALDGKDILGSAQTGTGKTGAFGIPLIAHLMNDPHGTALIMTPTRELAAQVLKQLRDMLGQRSKIKSALLIGGDSMVKQFRQLDRQPRLIVGTPGRIHDHIQRGTLSLEETKFLVLDETDRMLDMGFSIQIEAILEFMPHKRQTMLFSATLPRNIQKLSANYLSDPIRISVDPTSTPAKNIKQDVLKVNDADKYPQLMTELDERAGSVIVFMKTKYATEKMATKLSKDGYDAQAVHGDLRQSKRERVIAAFRKQKYRVLVATDVAARGLDIPHIEHVINYDLPQCPEDYIHRIGRTARAGAEGAAVCFVSPAERGKWVRIDRLMNPDKAKGKFEDDDFGGERRARRRPQSAFGDRKPNRRNGGGSQSFRDRKPRGNDRFSDHKPRSDDRFLDRKPRGDDHSGDFSERRSYSDRPKKRFDKTDSKRFDRPKRAFGQRQGEASSERPSFDKRDRRPGSSDERGDTQKRPQGNRKSFSKSKSGYGAKSRGPQKRSQGKRSGRSFAKKRA